MKIIIKCLGGNSPVLRNIGAILFQTGFLSKFLRKEREQRRFPDWLPGVGKGARHEADGVVARLPTCLRLFRQICLPGTELNISKEAHFNNLVTRM